MKNPTSKKHTWVVDWLLRVTGRNAIASALHQPQGKTFRNRTPGPAGSPGDKLARMALQHKISSPRGTTTVGTTLKTKHPFGKKRG